MLKQIIKKVYKILNPRERRQAMIILIISLISAVLDSVGVASVLPFMTVAANPDSIKTQPMLAWAYQALNFENSRDFLLFLGCISLVFLLASIFFRAFSTWAGLRFVSMREYSISQRLLELYLAQPYSWFLNHHSSELNKTVLSEVTLLTQSLMISLLGLITNSALSVAMVSLAVAMEPFLTVILICILGISYVASYKLSNRSLAKIAEQRFQANQMRFKIVSESLGAIKDLKATGKEYTFTRQYDRYAHMYAKKYVQAQVVAQTPRYILEALILGGILVVFLFFLTNRGSIAEIIPTLSLFALAGYRLIPSIQAIFGNLVTIRFNTPSLDAIHLDFSSLRENVLNNKDGNIAISFHKILELNQVYFSYPKTEKPVLRDLSLTLLSGTSNAIVGSTGSGKTTLVDLIIGLLSPSAGKILIDGIPLTIQTLRSWQSQVGYVSQQVFLLDDSVAANIAFGVIGQPIDLKNMERAAKQALIHDFIVSEMPDGYQTKLGERGVRLSGGQRQRLGIARALYRNPSLLIFDESTSALDSVTEREVIKSLESLRGQVTLIMITHRISTVQFCDRVLLIDNGSIKAQGTYHELSQVCQEFKQLNKFDSFCSD